MTPNEEVFKIAVKEVGTLDGPIISSHGVELNKYYDIRSVILLRPGIVRTYTLERLQEYSFDQVVATGNGGALLLGLLAPAGINGVLYNPKGHGVLWSPAPPYSKRVVLLDDVSTTGHTFELLREAVNKFGGLVIGEVALVDRTNEAIN